jgi:hypothetical protein
MASRQALGGEQERAAHTDAAVLILDRNRREVSHTIVAELGDGKAHGLVLPFGDQGSIPRAASRG